MEYKNLHPFFSSCFKKKWKIPLEQISWDIFKKSGIAVVEMICQMKALWSIALQDSRSNGTRRRRQQSWVVHFQTSIYHDSKVSCKVHRIEMNFAQSFWGDSFSLSKGDHHLFAENFKKKFSRRWFFGAPGLEPSTSLRPSDLPFSYLNVSNLYFDFLYL